MSDFQAGDGNVVTIHYTLTDSTGVVLDTSRDGDPFAYLHGGQNIVPGLESQLAGKAPGDVVQAVVEPDQGYGARVADAVIDVPKADLPADAELEVGMQLMAQQDDNTPPQPVWIAGIEGDTVKMDFNHPLAGQTLHFDVQVLEIRAATKEELDHGHPHGPGGHQH